MPKVLRIINRFNLGGPTLNVSYLSRYLDDGFETLLIGGVAEESEASSLFIPENLGLKPVVIKEMSRKISLWKDFQSFRKIVSIIRDYKPDIVHTHASKAGTIGRLAAIYCKVPVIVHTFHGHVFRNYFGKIKTGIVLRIERFLSKRTDAIIAISELQRKDLTETYKITTSEKCHVIRLGFDLNKFTVNEESHRKTFRAKYELQRGTIAIGIIGRLAPIKNHKLFIDAIINANIETGRSIQAFIIGDGELRNELEQYIQNQNAEKLFTFLGWQKEIDLIIPGLDIVALSSLNEGTPVSLIEAQAGGKIIVTTNAGGVKDILFSEASFVSHSDVEFKSNMINAINEMEAFLPLAESARNKVNHEFGIDRLIKETRDLYLKLLQQKGRFSA